MYISQDCSKVRHGHGDLHGRMLKEMSYDVVSAAIQAVDHQDESSAAWSMGISTECATVPVSMPIAPLTVGQIKLDQETDPITGQIIQYKLAETKPSGSKLKQLSPQVVCLLREWDKLQLNESGVLYRQTTNRKQLVLPEKHRLTVLKELHDEIGHHGAERTTSLVRDRFYWPFMQKEIEDCHKKVCVS